MSSRTLCTATVILWLFLFVGAFVAFFLTPAKDFGLSAGWNKVGVFFGWQLAAVTVAILAFGLSWSWPPRSWQRWIARGPAIVAVLGFAGIAALIVATNAPPPQPAAPPSDLPKTTAPAG